MWVADVLGCRCCPGEAMPEVDMTHSSRLVPHWHSGVPVGRGVGPSNGPTGLAKGRRVGLTAVDGPGGVGVAVVACAEQGCVVQVGGAAVLPGGQVVGLAPFGWGGAGGPG